jgi:hypothetical protein
MKLFLWILFLFSIIRFGSCFELSELQERHPHLKDDEVLLQALHSGELRRLAIELDPSLYSVSRASCHSPGDTSGLSTCSFIDYAWDGDAFLGESIISTILQSVNLTGNCLEAYTAFLCAAVFSRCSGNTLYSDICRCTCVNFAVKCGDVNQIPFGLALGCYSYPTTDCTDLRPGPSLICEPPPVPLSTCTVDWGIPQLSGGASAGAIQFLDNLVGAQVFIAGLSLSTSGVTPGRQQVCMAAYTRYVCSYYFPRCSSFSGNDACRLIPPCELSCEEFLATCPEWVNNGLGVENGCPGGVPVPTCSGTTVSWSWGFGDPHLTTLDGFSYTFNGLGEFWLVHSASQDVSVQVRYTQCPSVSGQNATCTSGVAIQSLGSDRAGFYVTEGVPAVTVKFNGVDQTTFPLTVGTATVTENVQNATLHQFTVTFSQGVTLLLRWDSEFLWVGVSAPETLHGALDGLVGYFDGVQWNDFTDSGGSVVHNAWNASETDIQTFGLSWQVTALESLFDYFSAPCTSYGNCNDPSFQYLLRSDVNVTAEAIAACSSMGVSGSFREGCLFDVSATNTSNWNSAAAVAEEQAWNLLWSQWATEDSSISSTLISWLSLFNN